MERVVETIKYRLILDHTVTKVDQQKTLKQRKFQVQAEIKVSLTCSICHKTLDFAKTITTVTKRIQCSECEI